MFGHSHARGKGSRVAWIVAGGVAAAVTLAVVVWEVCSDRTEDSDTERTGEESAEPALRAGNGGPLADHRFGRGVG